MNKYIKYSILGFLFFPCSAYAASSKLSAISNGGAYSTSTDQCVAVRNGNTDVLATITISDATVTFTDITTNNVSTSKHGFTPKAPNDVTKFLDGTGAWSVPAGGSGTTWPANKNIVVSNTTNSPTGLAEIDGDCVVGSAGSWTAGACATTSSAITSTSATAFAVGANGATNPVLNIDASTASQVGGVSIKGGATGSFTTITATDSGSNQTLSILSKGTGNLNLDSASGILNLRTSSGTTRQSIAIAQAAFTPGATASNTVHFLYTGPADTTLTAGTEVFAQNWNNAAAVRQHATGGLTLQRDFIVQGATHSFVSASTATDLAAFGVLSPGCGTNATCTNVSGIYHPSTALTVTGAITNSYGINIAADTGATNNYAAKFTGGIVYDGQFSKGTKFTTTGCSVSATTGGATAGTLTSGTTGTCTVVITMNGATGLTAPTGWTCWSNDETTNADKLVETSSTTTTATLSGTTVSGDVIDFGCTGF